jgi:hypothetical protein
VTGNVASSTIHAVGGGLSMNSSVGVLTVRNSIIAGNLTDGRAGADCDNTHGHITSQGHNLWGNQADCPNNVAGGDRNLPALGLNITAVLNTTLADNGGPTKTHNLVPSGPAVGRIPVALCSATTDQRGIARPQWGWCDSGAVESTARPTFPIPPHTSPYDVGVLPPFDELNSAFPERRRALLAVGNGFAPAGSKHDRSARAGAQNTRRAIIAWRQDPSGRGASARSGSSRCSGRPKHRGADHRDGAESETPAQPPGPGWAVRAERRTGGTPWPAGGVQRRLAVACAAGGEPQSLAAQRRQSQTALRRPPKSVHFSTGCAPPTATLPVLDSCGASTVATSSPTVNGWEHSTNVKVSL